MTTKLLEESFRSMGLDPGEVNKSMRNMFTELGGVKPSREVDDDGDYLAEDEDFETAYATGDDDLDLDLDGLDLDEMDEDELREAVRVMRMKKGTAKERRQAKQYYRKKKSKLARQRKKVRKTSGYKRRMRALLRAPKSGGARVRRVFSDRDTSGEPDLQEEMLSNMQMLAEGLDHDPGQRFDEYAKAFNLVADVGELLALKYNAEDDEESALDAFSLTNLAESVLKEMEELDGALTIEEDQNLESILSKAMEGVSEELAKRGLIESEDFDGDELDEDDDFDDDDFDEDDEFEVDEYSHPLLQAALALREARKKKDKPPKKVLKRLGKRDDVRNPEGLANYLGLVAQGKAERGEPFMKSKSGKPLNKGARRAARMKGR